MLEGRNDDQSINLINDDIFKTIVENTDIMISVTTFGIKPRYLYLNPCHENIMGYKPEELLGKNGFDFIHPEDKIKLLPLLKNYLQRKVNEIFKRTGEDISEVLEFRAKNKNNQWRNFECFAKLIPGNRILFISRDITEKKRIESELQIVKTDWQAIFNSLKQPAIILNKNFRVIDANQEVIQKTGLSINDIKKKKCFEIFHSENACSPAYGCPLKKLILSEDTETIDIEMETLGGTYMVSCTPVFDKNRKIDKIIHIATDISERKKIELALKENEEKYRTVVETAQEMIFIIKNGIIKYVNKALLKANNVNEDALIGKKFLDFVTPDEKQRVAEIYKNRMEQGIDFLTYESKAITLTGEIREVEVSSTFINFEGEPATLVILHDITDKKKAIRELQDYREHLEEIVKKRTLELEEKNKELEDYNQLFIGREFRIKELKDRIKELENKFLNQ
ncbi:MAG: PAS domain S-box protein [Prolixibacteraceae bacterium]|nr:PAS domain S-box protein [Prolixibacteraceae bacterium]